MAPSSPPSPPALLGGEPAFREPLHVGRPNLGDRARFLERLNGALDRRWLSNAGPLVQEFEGALRRRLAVRHCVAVANATLGLELLLRATGVTGEVIVPAFTFVATAHAVRWVGLTPVLADADPATHNLDPAAVERAITPATTAILGTHVWGNPCAVDALTALARRHGLELMFDAAHAFGCSHQGVPLGNFGRAEVFSFHATKFVNSFEGGAIATNDDELARRLRLMLNFGFAGYDLVVGEGTNAKLSEAAAAMGLTNLEAEAEFVALNRRHLAAYQAALADVPGVRLRIDDPAHTPNCQYVVAEVADDAPLNRDELVEVLFAENVLARRYFYPGVHRMEPYRSLPPAGGYRLPGTEALCRRVLVLPTGTAVTAVDIGRMGERLRAAVAQAAACRAAIQQRGWRFAGPRD